MQMNEIGILNLAFSAIHNFVIFLCFMYFNMADTYVE